MKQKAIFTVFLFIGVFSLMFTACFSTEDEIMDNSKSHSNIPSSQSTYNSESIIENNSQSTTSSSTQNGSSSLNNSHNNSENTASPSDNTDSLTNENSSSSMPASNILGNEWNLTLVNAQNPLKEGFSVNLRQIYGYEDRLFDERAADDLEAMLNSAKSANLELYLVSAYRTPQRQATLFENKVQTFINEGFMRSEAEKQAAMWVARAYTSEHNLGLAVDLVSKDWYTKNSDLTQEFENTEHFNWLVENCANFGFILRYPNNKQNITGVSYEPWHFRYVGQSAAQIIMRENITLEEYLNKV